jgi:hypothetical protein
MGKASLKQSEPVRLQHDGPIHRMIMTSAAELESPPASIPLFLSLALQEADDLLRSIKVRRFSFTNVLCEAVANAVKTAGVAVQLSRWMNFSSILM